MLNNLCYLIRHERDPANRETIKEVEKKMSQRKVQLTEMEQALPKGNGLYLRIILGNVNVSILNKDDKYEARIIISITQSYISITRFRLSFVVIDKIM